MEAILPIVNAWISGLMAVALLIAVVIPQIRDGVVIKTGLIGMACGFAGLSHWLTGGLSCGELVAVVRCLLLINIGLLVVIGGYALKKRRRRHPVRRLSDWTCRSAR